MTPNELLALLGRAWSRLLLYPGGLAAFGAIWLIARALRRPAWFALDIKTARSAVLLASRIAPIVLPWLGIALLPLPGAVRIGYVTDVLVVLALLDAPLLLALHGDLRANGNPDVRRLAATLNGYPTLLLGFLLLALSTGSLQLEGLSRVPTQMNLLAVLHWMGAAALVAALPAVLVIGPFAPRPTDDVLTLGLRLRGIGFVALVSLPWLAFGEGHVWLPLPPVLIGLFLWLCSFIQGRRLSQLWARGYYALDWLLLLALLVGTFDTLRQRLT